MMSTITAVMTHITRMSDFSLFCSFWSGIHFSRTYSRPLLSLCFSQAQYVNLTEQVVSESFARKWARGPRTMKQSVQMTMRRHAANFGCGSVSQSPEPLWRARHRPVLLRPRAWQRFVSIPGEAILDRDLIAGCCALAASRADATSFA
jgi:hypothetical protein